MEMIVPLRSSNEIIVTGNQASPSKGTSFPGSPVTDDLRFRTDFRAWFQYDGSIWRQVSDGSFSGSFPSSPTTGLRVWRDDFTPRRLYAYDGSVWQLLVGSVGCRVYNSAAITLANATVTVLTFDSEREDTDAIHSTVTNTGRLTAPVAGRYLITGMLRYAAAANNTRYAQIRLNGSTFIASNSLIAAVSDNHDLTVVTIYRLAANDYVEFVGYQNSGGSVNVTANGNFSPEFALEWLGG